MSSLKKIRFVLIFHFLCLSNFVWGQLATITESKQLFHTYPFGDPDPVARMNNIYPYFRFEGYSLYPVEKEWKIVTLENPYIKVLIAPEIGGKILGAFEKKTEKAFIYYNKVVKFREIAMRGPWTSGGIEFNFGDIGHTPATATPVDYLTRTNADGSVSCIAGSIDLPSRTEWRVEIKLSKDKAYFTTHSFWYNPTELSTSLYHWMNAAADASEDLHLIYPGSGYIGHGGEYFSWPKDSKGRNLSFYTNNNFGSYKSYHVLGTYTDFYAAHYANDDFGVVHWSPFTDKPGKKIWIWGLSRQGEIWKNLLTDPELGNKQYVEIQSGLLFNQAAGGSTRTPFKHLSFAPYGAERFDEAWYPFLRTGGLVEANLSGALNVERKGNQLKISFCPLQKISEEIQVSLNGKNIYSKKIDLNPLDSFKDVIQSVGEGELQVSVGKLITYNTEQEEAKKLQRPVLANNNFDWTSSYGLYLDGVERTRQRDYNGALEKFLASLKKENLFTPAIAAAANVYYRMMEYEKALKFVTVALTNDAYDPEASFIYGLVNRKLGRYYDAKDGFGTAARSTEYRSAAYQQLAEVSLLEGDLSRAEEFARRALDYDRFNIKAYQILAIVFRKEQHVDDAKSMIEKILQLDPLNHAAHFESYLLDPTDTRLTNFKSMIRWELPQESYLEMASTYFNLGLFNDAVKVLEQSPRHAIVQYWLAYLYAKIADENRSKVHLHQAIQSSPYLVFPYRTETIDILHWALNQQPAWQTNYYLALAYWSKNRTELAELYFAACGNEPEYAAFYVTRANFMKAKNSSLALQDYLRALEKGPNEWRAYRVLADYYTEHGEFSKTLEITGRSVQKFPTSYVVQFNHARTLLLNRNYTASLAILDTITILPFEGAQYGREAYRQVCVLRAAELMKEKKVGDAISLIKKARDWPERLGVGKPYEVDDRLENYLEAVCQKNLNKKTEAATLFKRVTASTGDAASDSRGGSLLNMLALKELGKQEELGKAFKRLSVSDTKEMQQKINAAEPNVLNGMYSFSQLVVEVLQILRNE
ncbi:MAG: DUF5107 domain-containing protein [bacterium]